jgi:hypothetical protein
VAGEWVSGRVRESTDGLAKRPAKTDQEQFEAALREAVVMQANPDKKERENA